MANTSSRANLFVMIREISVKREDRTEKKEQKDKNQDSSSELLGYCAPLLPTDFGPKDKFKYQVQIQLAGI